MGNFDFLREEAQFDSFAATAITAEWLYRVNLAVCVATCRQAMEFAIKWMYLHDGDLTMPATDRLAVLMSEEAFVQIIGPQMQARLELIRRLGNDATHLAKSYTPDQAALALENLYYFCRFLQYCYGEAPLQPPPFDRALLTQAAQMPEAAQMPAHAPTPQGQQRQDQSRRRRARIDSFDAPALQLGEFETRKIYIDALLQEAGWFEGTNLRCDVPLKGDGREDLPQTADYVLYGRDGAPLAIVEAIGSLEEVRAGMLRAQMAAGLLEKQTGRRPALFLSNGFETQFWTDPDGAPRAVSGLFSQSDLEFERSKAQRRLDPSVRLENSIADRYYQKEAVRAVLRAFGEQRRQALLSMAAGSGKTRTALLLCDALLRMGVVKNILFLAEEPAMATQMRREADRLLTDVTVSEPSRHRHNLRAQVLCATYESMGEYIDGALESGGGRIFTAGHFDLIICDEANWTVYGRHRALLTYFDALLVGLTDCGAQDIDPRTYHAFGLEAGKPTYAYDLSRAIADGYLVDYACVRTRLRLLRTGIVYDALEKEEKERFLAAFGGGKALPRRIDPAAIGGPVFNEDSAGQMLAVLMRHGVKVDRGAALGKTIVFASSRTHADQICRVFQARYPHLPAGYCRVVDSQEAYSQDLVDDFCARTRLPRIAVSVGALDAGIDVPACVNLVFFKRVENRELFMRMVGRGTRPCKGLIDGKNKEKFLVFDFFGNFEAFSGRYSGEGAPEQMPLPAQIFCLQAQLLRALQAPERQSAGLTALRASIVQSMVGQMRALDRGYFAVRACLKQVETYCTPEAYDHLDAPALQTLTGTLAALTGIGQNHEPERTLALDRDFYALMLHLLEPETQKQAPKAFAVQMRQLADAAAVPGVREQARLIRALAAPLASCVITPEQLETARRALRGPAALAGRVPGPLVVNFADAVEQIEFFEPSQRGQEAARYRARVEEFLDKNPNDAAIVRLRSGEALDATQVNRLRRIAWQLTGTQAEFDAACGGDCVGVYLRRLTGMRSANVRGALYGALGGCTLSDDAKWFVQLVSRHLAKAGVMLDKSVLTLPPFEARGSCLALFDTPALARLLGAIDQLNAHAQTADAPEDRRKSPKSIEKPLKE